MPTRTFAVTAAVVSTAVLATTGITYASTVGSTEAAPSVKHAARKAAHAAAHAAPPAKPAAHAKPAAPTPAAREGAAQPRSGEREEGGGRSHDHGGDHKGPGWIHFNERTYSAATEGCITAASGLGSSSFSIDNDSKKIVEVYRGFTCDNGSPVATVGPHGSTFGVVTSTRQGDSSRGEDLFRLDLRGDDGIVGSFRVLDHEDEW
ncbi:hypothetical protein [Streptomyces glomeratus]|uniref:Serine/threonine protein kinase n=1 Tax=Streptomyces glomeratus TaxID=284452 RepID=A0ABP6L0B9_9ACTN|nr:hypothetical protein [Streptomyces glomeratus]MCF1511978.1 hypothetical protein [Streptomyces glomeratus]